MRRSRCYLTDVVRMRVEQRACTNLRLQLLKSKFASLRLATAAPPFPQPPNYDTVLLCMNSRLSHHDDVNFQIEDVKIPSQSS